MDNNKIKRSMQQFAINQALNYIEGDPEENIPKLMDLVDRFSPDGWFENHRKAIRKVIEEKGNWYQLILKLYELDPGVRKRFFENFILNANLKGSITKKEMEEKYDCNVPWAMLLDPTSACNLKCKGCWAAEYGNHLNLSLETLDSIITQGKEGILYSVFVIYGEESAEYIVDGQLFSNIEEMKPMFAGVAADRNCSSETVQKVYDYICETRNEQTYAMLPWDLLKDSEFIDSVISEDSCMACFDEYGRLITYKDGYIMTELNVFEQPLKQVLKSAFYK